jgi:aromatic-L-amino-acid decarboxylase
VAKIDNHMGADEFRRRGRQVVDWIADYWERVEQLPVLSQVEPGSVRERLPAEPPEQGEPFDAILRDVDEIILPGITHWQSPNFFGYFPANVSGPAVLGELLSAGLGVQGMLWSTSPACTELETHMLDWMAQIVDLPEKFLSTGPGGGVIQDSASSAVLCALIAARERISAGDCNREGCRGKLTVYITSQTHSSVEKGVKIAGLGRASLRVIPVDPTYAMQPAALADQIDADRAAGYQPCLVCATLGTTSSNAIDPLIEIGPVCQQRGVWLHVDAAMSGSAAVCPELRHIHAGMEAADSYCFNPHKWLLTNFDCDCFYVADRASLIEALSIQPEYLRNRASQSGAVIDYRDWQIPLGRRFRALKLWFVIRHYGVEGLRQFVRHHVALAQEFAGWVEQDDRFELAAPVPLNLVCFRHKQGDAMNQRILDQINASGALLLTHTRLDDRLTLRMSIGQTHTQRRHVAAAWQEITAAVEGL